SVVREAQNRGPRHVFEDPAAYALLPDKFCVTDPDLAFNPALPNDFLAQLAALTERERIGKAGFALDIADPDRMQQGTFRIGEGRYRIWEWEAQFWRHPLAPASGGDPVYEAPIDTTFALYNKRHFDPANFLAAVRV